MFWQRFSRFIPYVVYLFFICLDQAILSDLTEIRGARIFTGSLFVILIALYKSDVAAMWFGAAVAFILNTGDPGATGTLMILTALVVVAAANLKSRLNLDSLSARMAILIIGVAMLEVTQILFAGVDDITFTLVRYTAPSILYSTIVACLAFLILDGHISFRRFRELI